MTAVAPSLSEAASSAVGAAAAPHHRGEGGATSGCFGPNLPEAGATPNAPPVEDGVSPSSVDAESLEALRASRHRKHIGAMC